MSMTVQRRKDTRTPRVFMHKVADIRGGVSVKVSELGGDYLREGAVLSAPDNGICHVVKTAVLMADATSSDTKLKVEKTHNFLKGDYVMFKEGAKAYAVTDIVTSAKQYDELVLSATLGEEMKKGDMVVEAAAESADTSSALKYTPLSVVGTGKPFIQGSNLDTDAWLIGVTKGNSLPECVAKHLPGIINY